MTDAAFGAISASVVAICGVLTIWIKNRPPRERRRIVVATPGELESLERTIAHQNAQMAHQNGQMAEMRKELTALSRDVKELRKALRMHSHETHLYRSAVSDCVIHFPETGVFWDQRREVINGAVIAKASD